MNQQIPQGNPVPPYQQNTPNAPVRGNVPQGYGQQPRNYGQQWNAAPNFNPQGTAAPNGQQAPDGKNAKKKNRKKGGGSLIGWILLGILLMLVLIVGGAFLGYRAAVSARMAEYTRLSAIEASKQYQMALEDVAKGNYANAKTRIDYIREIDPNYPGLNDLLIQVQLNLYPTASPTPVITPTPGPTPTQDTRGEEEMFRGIQQAMYSQNWQSAIEQINALRNKNIEYRGLEVDGMYYIALRNYGMYQINAGYLENGVYNIALAESFGPIDKDANSLRDAARSYLTGAGFWEINWSRAMELYQSAAATYPNLFDRATMLTANQRYAEASFNVANEYVAREDPCGAIQYYDQGLLILQNETVQITATAAYNLCYPPQPTAAPDSGSSGEEFVSGDDETYDEWEVDFTEGDEDY